MTDIPDIEALFADLGKAHPGKGRYNQMDKYRDFRAVFLGSEQGRRVLYEILSMGHMFTSAPVLGGFEPNRTMFHGGEQNVVLGIFRTAHVEPKAVPDRQVSHAKE